MGRVYRRTDGGATWWGYWRDAKGRKHQKSLRTADRGVAVERLRQLELAPPDRPTNRQTLGTALKHLLDTVYAGRAEGTLHCYRHKARHLARVLGEHTPLGAVTAEEVLRYRALRLTEQAAGTSIAKELVVLRRTLAEAGIAGIVPKARTSYAPRMRHCTRDEAEAILAELHPDRRLWFLVGVYAGLRAGELERLDWEDVDLARGIITVRGTKTAGSFRPVPIPAELEPWLRDFEGRGEVLRSWGNQRRDLAAACVRARKRVGGARIGVYVAPVTANDLRRTFASWLVQGGASLLVVAHLLGHKSTRMVEMVYGRLTPATYRDAVGVLPALAVDRLPGVYAVVHPEARKDAPGANKKKARSR